LPSKQAILPFAVDAVRAIRLQELESLIGFIKFYLLRALACRHTHNEFHNLGLFAFRHGFNLFDYVSGIHAKYVVDGKRSDKGSGAKLGDILGDKPLCAFIPVA